MVLDLFGQLYEVICRFMDDIDYCGGNVILYLNGKVFQEESC